MSACTMKSRTPPATQRFLRTATSADFLKKVCDTPSMIDARMTRATPRIASTGIAVVGSATDKPDARDDEKDARDLQRVELLAEPRHREPQNRDVAERGDGRRIAE